MSGFFDEKFYEVEDADKYCKRVIKNAKYMIKNNSTCPYTQLIHPFPENKEVNLEKEAYYVDEEGNIYTKTYTNNYDDLIKYYNESEKGKNKISDTEEQMDIFSFIEDSYDTDYEKNIDEDDFDMER